jgi:transposase-like protein
MKHKTEDYKNSAVQYYLKNNDNIRKTCKIFNCKKSTLQRWIQRYKKYKNTTRRSRKSVSYKVKKEQVKSALKMVDENEQEELLFEMKNKYRDFDISRQHLGRIIGANNRTRKRTRHQHFPKERRKQPTNKSKEFEDFYNEVKKYSLNKIICLDETSIGSHLKPSYSRCYVGKRCIIKPDNNFVFRSFTLLVAINNSKCVGKIFYEKG